ncbi:hypothetical protein M1466_03420 [Candidatus Dependentiae bacterium]|nr:hypothetical protein [Candidatus Dependentiae bacterium]
MNLYHRIHKSIPHRIIVAVILALTLVVPATYQLYAAQAATTPRKTVLVFDIGGVLLRTNSSKLTRNIAKPLLGAAWISSIFNHRKDSQGVRIPIQGSKRMRAGYYQEVTAMLQDSAVQKTYDDQGALLPPLLAHWQLGRYTAANLQEIANNYGKTNRSIAARAAVQLVNAMIDPINFMASVEPIESMIQFIRQAALAKDAHGNQLVTICLLSNWAKEAWDILLQQEYHTFVKYAAVAVCSGETHIAKPEPGIYEALIARAVAAGIDMQNSTVIFIDDSKPNRDTGEQFGWQCFDPAELATVRSMLQLPA